MKTKAEETKEMRKKALKEARKNIESLALDNVFNELGIPSLKELNEMAKDEPLTIGEIINGMKKDN